MSESKKHRNEPPAPVLTGATPRAGRKNSRRQSQRKRKPPLLDRVPTLTHKDLSPSSPPPNEKRPETGDSEDSTENITALPLSPVLGHSPHLRPITRDNTGIPYNFQLNADSQQSIPSARERGKLHKTISRRQTTDAPIMPRRKSSRRDPIREEEIRAMSAPVPMKRPATFSGGLLRRDSKKMKHGLNRHFDRPTSNISLPLAESIHSSMSGGSEQKAFRVNALDIFSARPTIRLSISNSYKPHQINIEPFILSDARKKDKLPAVPDRGRIGDLADDMNASSLREVMERDRRRKEKKRKQEEDKLRRALQKKADKQRAKELRSQPETGTIGVKAVPDPAVGLGIAEAAAAETEQKSSKERADDTAMDIDQPTDTVKSEPATVAKEEPSPSAAEFIMPAETPMETPMEEPVVGTAEEIRYSHPPHQPTSPKHARVPSDTSHLPDLPSEADTAPVVPVPSSVPSDRPSQRERRSSDTSGRRMGIWASIFRRGTSSKRGSLDQGKSTPSEISFSNTSRESMGRQPLPAHLANQSQIPAAFVRRASGTPQRTMSKFREDLPDFPPSPPDSRVQSPEVEPVPPIASRRGQQDLSAIQTEAGAEADDVSAVDRLDSPVSPPPDGRASALMSQSLGSVDSEGSWLSGKPVKRRSNQRSSIGTVTQNQQFNASYEELGIPEDEYFRRLTPQADEKRFSQGSGLIGRKASSNAIGAGSGRSSMEQNPVAHGAVARTPTVVHREDRHKSREGLLNDFQAGDVEDPSTPPSPTKSSKSVGSVLDSPTEEDAPIVMERAKSIDFGKGHARQLSAGSARLLDIPAKRSSLRTTPAASGAGTPAEPSQNS
jgi:hypothetical protein